MTSPRFSTRDRLVFSGLAILLAVTPHALMHASGVGDGGGTLDFDHHWDAAQALLAGLNPYRVMGSDGPEGFSFTYFYPLPTAILTLPLGLLPAAAARLIFVVVSAAVLGWFASREGMLRAPMILSAPFLYASAVGQWGPLMTAFLLAPALGFLAIAKPQLGLALLFGGTDRKLFQSAVIGATVLTAVALILHPGWPLDWLEVLRTGTYGLQSPLLLAPGGALLLLALIRWRSPGARLLTALACVPQTGFIYDALPLFLICRTRRQGWILSGLSFVVFAIQLFHTAQVPEVAGLDRFGELVYIRDSTRTWMVWLMYLPTLFFVLRRRPDEVSRAGSVPAVSPAPPAPVG